MASSRFEPIYHLRVSEKKKFSKKGEWFRRYMDYIIPYDTTVVDNYKQMLLYYQVINDNIDGFKAELERFCRTKVPESISAEIEFDEDLVHYGRIFSKFQYMVGEMRRRPQDRSVTLISNEAMAQKNAEFSEALRASLNQFIFSRLYANSMALEGQPPEAVEAYMQQVASEFMDPNDLASSEFKSQLEIFGNRVLDYAFYSEEVERKRIMSFKHAITADIGVIYVGEHYGKPGIHVINPLHFGFHKAPDEYRIEKGDYAWSRTAITMGDVMNLYEDVLTQEEIERLSTYTYSSALAVNERHNVIGRTKGQSKITYDPTAAEMLQHFADTQYKTVGQAMGSGTNRKYNTERLIYHTHFEFKAFRELGFLTYTDELGEEITDVLPADFTLPEEATKEKFTNRYGRKSTRWIWVEVSDDGMPREFIYEKLWIPRRYEVTRLGQDVYVNYREVPNQPLNLEDPYGSFELSYKGRIFSSVNSRSLSLVGRALPAQFQYDLIKNLQNHELKKYEGYIRNINIDEIPDYLAQDENGEPIPGLDKMAVWRYWRRKFGDSYTSATANAGGLPNPNRSLPVRPEVSGAMAEIMNMEELLMMVDREIGMQMGIPPQAEGQIASYTSASDNQRALDQGYTMQDYYFAEHDQLWSAALSEYLAQFRNYYRRQFDMHPGMKEQMLNYITPAGTRELLRVTPEHLSMGDMGVYIDAGESAAQYRQIMMQQIHAFSQNAGQGIERISELVHAITSGRSPREIHKMLAKATREQAEQMQAMQQQEMMMMEREREMQNAKDQADKQFELLKTQIASGANVSPELQNAKLVAQMQAIQRSIDQRDREIALKERKIQQEEQKALREDGTE